MAAITTAAFLQRIQECETNVGMRTFNGHATPIMQWPDLAIADTMLRFTHRRLPEDAHPPHDPDNESLGFVIRPRCEVPTIELVRIEVDGDKRRQGVFKAYIQALEDYATANGRVVYVESILTQFLFDYLVHKRGYTELAGHMGTVYYDPTGLLKTK